MSQQAQETVVVSVDSIPDEIDVFRIIRRAGRSDRAKAHAVASHLSAIAAPVSSDSDLLKEAVGLLREYRDKTPLGHQPHMIAARADAFLSKVEERG